jgi:hypothetical protein
MLRSINQHRIDSPYPERQGAGVDPKDDQSFSGYTYRHFHRPRSAAQHPPWPDAFRGTRSRSAMEVPALAVVAEAPVDRDGPDPGRPEGAAVDDRDTPLDVAPDGSPASPWGEAGEHHTTQNGAAGSVSLRHRSDGDYGSVTCGGGGACRDR